MSGKLLRVVALVALIVILSIGCFAHHSATPLGIKPLSTPVDHERKVVIGVQEPIVRLDPPLFEGAQPEAWTTLAELNQAIALIRSMRAADLYREVDFESQLACAPDVVIKAQENPKLATCDADAPWALVFLGIIPVWYTCDGGHYFSRADRESRRFEFPWHETQLFGWFMPLFNLFPGWTWKPPEPNRLHDAFRAFFLAHESELLEGIEPQLGDPCPAN